MNTRRFLSALTCLAAVPAILITAGGCSSDSPTGNTSESGLIYYSRSTQDRKSADLVSIRADGTEETVVMHNAYMVSAPTNGTMLVALLSGGDQKIAMLDLHTGQHTEIATLDEPNAAGLSRDGSRFWYSVYNSSDPEDRIELHVANIDGSNDVLITERSPEDGVLAFSPDGNRVAYFTKGTIRMHSNPDSAFLYPDSLFVCNSDGTGRQLISDNAESQGDFFNSLQWFPDGTRILFARRGENPDEDAHFWTIRPDGTGERRLTGSPILNEATPDFSGDGSKVALIGGIRPSSSNLDIDIWTVNTDGTDQRNLTNTPDIGDAEVFPKWSPDDKSILYLVFDLNQPGDPYAGSLHVLNVESGESRTLVESQNVINALWGE